jgi:aminomethyltransferase
LSVAPFAGAHLMSSEVLEKLDKLPLDGWHREHGGRMVPFAGYEMPVQYEGIIAEHLWTRENAGLFDVSHMGQLLVHGRGADAALETLMPGDFLAASDMKPKYSLLLDDDGGIIDDLMATRRGEDFYVVVNGATKHGDIKFMESRLPGDVVIDHMRQQALLALQGPRAAEVLDTIVPGVSELSFMQAGPFRWEEYSLWISRSGYTGEDGFEISVPANAAAALADAIVAHELAKPIGLGARDSLRLEAGLPLYGHDLDVKTTPVMAGLTFAINKRRRAEGGFPGALRILAELADGPPQKRVGFDVDGRQPVREGALVLDGEGNEVGKITSGGFSPSLQRPIAMGYVAGHLAEPGTALKLEQRGKLFDARVTAMPFVPHRYYRKGAA